MRRHPEWTRPHDGAGSTVSSLLILRRPWIKPSDNSIHYQMNLCPHHKEDLTIQGGVTESDLMRTEGSPPSA